MFEREIKFIYDFNLNKIKRAGSYLTFEQLVSLDIHPAILKYISAEIDYLIFEDRQKLLHDSVFDYSGEKINDYFSLIDGEIKKSKKLSIEYLDKLLLHAISFIVNYLVRPRWTLSRFLFDKDESKGTAEVKQIINYVYFYNYLIDTLVSYFDKKNMVSVEKTEIDELIEKIDNFAVESYLENIIGTAVNSISDFFSIGTVQQNKVPIYAIKLFLEEKNLFEHIQKLETVFEKDDKLKYSISDLLKILSSGELSLNLKPMETEQIDEDELEQRESVEFEPAENEEIINYNSVESTTDTEENLNSELENPVLPHEDLPNGNNIHEQISYKTANTNEEEKIRNFDEKPPIDASIQPNDAAEKEVFDKTEQHHENILQTTIPEFNEEATDITNNMKETAIQNTEISADDKFEFEKLEENPEEKYNNHTEQAVKSFVDETITTDIDISDLENEEHKEEIEPAKNLENENIKTELIENENTVTDTANNETQLSGENTQEETLADEILSEQHSETQLLEDELSSAAFQEAENSETITDNITDTQNTINEEFSSEKLIEEDVTAGSSSEESYTHEAVAGIMEEMESDIFGDVEPDNTEETFEEGKGNVLPEEIQEKSKQDFGDVEQPELFPEENVTLGNTNNQDQIKFEMAKTETEQIDVEKGTVTPQIELSELLENKNMNKILKVVFDYDMDDFIVAIDRISECKNEKEALKLLDTIYNANEVKQSSKEAKIFNSIITEYFKKI